MPNLAEAQIELSPDMISETSGEPLYLQILKLLREKIVSGEAAPGSRLPAEQDMTGLLGVSRITVKRALNELASSGLVRRQRGRGTVVTFDPAAPTVKGSFENLIDGLTRMGLKTHVKLIEAGTAKADATVAEALDLGEGDAVRRIVRTRSLEGQPFSYLVTHMPMDVAGGFTDEELGSQSLIALLEKAGFAPREAEQTITAAAAEATVANALGVPMGTPVLRIHRIMRDKAHRPVQDITATYRADRFQYQMNLTRQSAADWAPKD